MTFGSGNERGQGFFSAACFDDLELTESEQGFLDKIAVSLIVVHNHRSLDHGAFLRSRFRLGVQRAKTRGMAAKNVEPSPGSLLNRNISPEKLSEFPRQGQTQPDALRLLLQRIVDLAEFLEDSIHVLGRDPEPAILDREDHHDHRRPAVAVTLISPRSVNFTALVRKFRRICVTFPSSVFKVKMPEGSSNTSETRSWLIIGRMVPCRASKSVPDLEGALPDRRLSCFDSGQVQQVVDQGR